MMERFYRQLKAALKAHKCQDWMAVLPLVLLGIRTALKSDIGCSVAELVYGTTHRGCQVIFLYRYQPIPVLTPGVTPPNYERP